jgi:hypothetical protein
MLLEIGEWAVSLAISIPSPVKLSKISRFYLVHSFSTSSHLYDQNICMTKGLLWLPLLAVFFWLAWAGWNEYQKLESYRIWAEQFDRAKYDIYAVLGQKGNSLTWGKPTRRGPIDLQTFDLQQVESIQLIVGDRVQAPDSVLSDSALPDSALEKPGRGQIALAFHLPGTRTIRIPFTELAIASQWAVFLQKEWQRVRSTNV